MPDQIARHIALLLAIGLALATPRATTAQPVTPASPADGLPPRRTLTGNDASRVQEMDDFIKFLVRSGNFEDAQGPARLVAEIRTRVQGAGDWETADAERRVVTLRKVAALPVNDRGEVAEAIRLNAESNDNMKNGKYQQAEDSYRKSLDIRRRLLGEDHHDTAMSYSNLATLLGMLNRYAEAAPLFREALAISIKTLGEDHPETATTYNNMAAALRVQGKSTEAATVEMFRKALAIRLRFLPEGHPDTATSYSNLAVCLLEQGNLFEAEALLHLALAMQIKVLPKGHPDIAQSLNNLAGCLSEQGKHGDAEALLLRVLEMRLKALPEGHPEVAQSYNNLGGCLSEQGRYDVAEPLQRKALAMRLKALPEGHPDSAESYNNLALCLQGQGSYGEAVALMRKALSIQVRSLPQGHPNTARSYGNVASCLDNQGKHAEAEAMHRKAQSILRASLGETHSATTTADNNLALCLNLQGKSTQAEELFRKILATRRKAFPEGHPDMVTSYNNLAGCLGRRPESTEDETLFRQALAMQLKLFPDRPSPTTALCYHNLARCLQDEHKYADSEWLYRESLAIELKLLGEFHPTTATTYSNLAACLHAQRKSEEAERLFVKAATILDQSRLSVSLGGMDRASFSPPDPHSALAVMLARRGEPNEAWDHLEGARARGLLDEISARWARPLTQEDRRREQELRAELHSVEEQVAALSRGIARDETRDRRTEELQRLRAELRARWDEFEVGLSDKYGAVAGQVDDLVRIQRNLPEDSALVGWLDVEQSSTPGGREDWACLVRRQGRVTWVEVPGSGPQSAWTKDDIDLPGQVVPELSIRPDNQAGGWKAKAASLAAQRLDPLDRHLGARAGEPPIRHLIVMPSAALSAVPIEALVEARPAGKPRYTISYAPSGTMLAWLREQSSARQRPGPARLLALGDPAFEPPTPRTETPAAPDHGIFVLQVMRESNAERGGIRAGDVIVTCDGKPVDGAAALGPLTKPGRAAEVRFTLWRDGKEVDVTLPPGRAGFAYDRRPLAEAIAASREADNLLKGTRAAKLERLPRTRREVESIASLFRGSTLLLGDEASERKLNGLVESDELKGYSHLLLATHGKMDSRIALNSRLFLVGDRDEDPARAIVEGRPVFDGELTAQDLLRWKLDADLVTLSACETGLGKFSAGEGYLGFTQALFVAGARSVVLSLWKVDDRATSLLMVRFHENILGRRDGLAKPMPKAEALREAKEWLRGLTVEEADDQLASLDRGEVRKLTGKPASPSPTANAPGRPPGRYAHPYYWAAFILVGDPS